MERGKDDSGKCTNEARVQSLHDLFHRDVIVFKFTTRESLGLRLWLAKHCTSDNT